MTGSARGYVLAAFGAVAGIALGLGVGVWLAAEQTNPIESAQGALAAFVSILFIPVFGGIGCVLSCYGLLRAAGEPAPFRTGLFTIALILLTSFVPTEVDNVVLLVLIVAAAGVLGRRIALATVSGKASPPP